MFTGIIKELGVIHRISGMGNIRKLSVEAKDIVPGTKIGDSVAVNGVCLTMTGKNKNILDFDVMSETARTTNISRLGPGGVVNLEAALKAGDPFGGHFVTGHVDCVGRVRSVIRTGDNYSIKVFFPEEYKRLVVEKGSIALDGISLTVGRVEGNNVTVYIIPHTLKTTTLGSKGAGHEVNIEFDIMGKYALGEDKRSLGKFGTVS
jgi:riboflavin synthase